MLKNNDDGDEEEDDDGREKKYKQRPCAKNGNKNVGIRVITVDDLNNVQLCTQTHTQIQN